jgi:hypothetical protein
MNDIWITHYSLTSWNSESAWDAYLQAIEAVLGDRLLKLDDTDPVRRSSDTKNGEGSFVVQFGEHEASRWIRGKFKKTKIEIEIKHYKSGQDSFGRKRENRLSFYIPERMAFGTDRHRLIELFRLGNEQLGAFYAYADFKGVVCSKRPSTPSLDISCELLGIFWLTYFGPRYCDFFTLSRLLNLHGATAESTGGVTLQLAETPDQVGLENRGIIEGELGELSFAGYGTVKQPGQYALTLTDLAAVSS